MSKENIVSIPLYKIYGNLRWVNEDPIAKNIIRLFKECIPSNYFFSFFKDANDTKWAKEIVYHLSKHSLDENQILSYLKSIKLNFQPNDPQGEFNTKLYYAIRKVEALPAPIPAVTLQIS